MPEDREKTGKIYCANCKNCKVLLLAASDGESKRRVRCAAGHWKKKLGGEKMYAVKNVLNRVPPINPCPDYDEMGETKPYVKELRNNPFPDAYAD